MTTELFSGTYQKLKDRIDAIIATPATINHVIKLNNGQYLIIYT